jgi:hypothetical protein
MRYRFARLTFFAAMLVPLACVSGLVPLARFDSERITIHVFPEHVTVDGLYYYRNPYPFEILQGMSIPFPTDERHPTPTELRVEEVWPDAREIPFRTLMGRPRFDLPLPAFTTICVRVHYYQRALGGDAQYILTTTQPWLLPLREGEYRLVSNGVTALRSNYPLTPTNEGTAIFRRTRFMPRQNWSFSWQPDQR